MTIRRFALMTTAILLLAAALTGASDIDNCCFVDRQCHSDQQWIDGYWAFQSNQCSAPTASQPIGGGPVQVDNCCFVDRQCHSDQQWIDGYWAFQNNQCSAPAPSQPIGGGPAQVDNCCFVNRQCHSELEWRAGWHAYQNNQCAVTGQTRTVASPSSASGVLQRTDTGIVIGYAGGPSILPSTTPFPFPGSGHIGQIFSYSYNNCCQYHWQCNNNSDWDAGYDAFQTNGHCARPGLISIVGDRDFVDFYAGRLNELKNRLPQRYNYVLKRLGQDPTG